MAIYQRFSVKSFGNIQSDKFTNYYNKNKLDDNSMENVFVLERKWSIVLGCEVKMKQVLRW